VTEDGLKLTIYFGERDRAGGVFLADALAAVYARHELRTSLVLRGIEGFGAKQHLRTDRLLTLSEDLPLVAVAVDRPERIEAVVREVEDLRFDGLVTLERVRMPAAPFAEQGPDEPAKLTVYLGRREQAGGRPAHEAVVDLLHARGIAGATVLLGVDGTLHGARRRARFFARNEAVPLMVVSVGDAPRIAGVLPALDAMLARPLVTLERVRVCKRDGAALVAPHAVPGTDASGLGVWHKLTVFAGEQSPHGDRPLHSQLVRALRAAGAAGATSLRGVRGYHGDHAPHGDVWRQLRRRVPVVTTVVDTPERSRRWFEIVDELTDETGLVTSELVPACRVTGPALERGGLRLAQPVL